MILLSNIIKAEYVVFDYQQPKDKNISIPIEGLYDIYNQREIILKEADEEAMKIINAAKIKAYNEIAECKKRGYEEGYNAGMANGKNKGYAEGYEIGIANASEIIDEQNRNKLKEISEMIEKIENQKQLILEKYEKGLIQLSIEIAEKIIRYRIDSEDGAVSKIIEDVIKGYRNIEWIKVYISNKDDLITVQADKNLANELNKISKDVKIEISDNLEAGSVVVETSEGIVDASVDTQLKNLKEMVLNKNAC
jgi:flagellar assembly protein FliH